MAYEATLRLGVFLGLFIILATAESLMPRRLRSQARPERWFTNLGLIVIDVITLRFLAILLPVVAIAAAIDAQAKNWGLFQAVDLPVWLEFFAAILLLDFLIWAQHLITHKIPILWRLHQVHHADRDMDVTTALRFHPIEIALSMLLKVGAIYLLGPMAVAVLAFEIILNGMAMFNHANLRLPLWLDSVLRTYIVTPDMHRIHHSSLRSEHDSNYGFSISLWDRLFGTYNAQPKAGHDGMEIGLRWQDERPASLIWTLLLPFRHK